MQDHLAEPPVSSAPLPVVQPDNVDLIDLVSSVKRMAHAMQARLMDENGNLKKDIPIREGKEAISSVSTLLSTILRNKDALENRHYQQQFDAAVISVLEEMDTEHRTDYLTKLQAELETVEVG